MSIFKLFSKQFNGKTGDYSGVKVLTADEVWVKGRNGFTLNNKYKYPGKVKDRTSNFILNTRVGDKNTRYKYVGDVGKLTNKTRNEIVDCFYNRKDGKKNRRVVYLAYAEKTER